MQTTVQTTGYHGATNGQGRIQMRHKDGARMMWVEYTYTRGEDGNFTGSVSTWSHEPDGAGLVAIMSRVLPTRAAMLEWIYAKAERLAEG